MIELKRRNRQREPFLEDLGELGTIIRELAGYSPDRYAEVMHWSVAEALAAYEARLKADAAREYQAELMIWAIFRQAGSKEKQPEQPEVLKG